MTKHLLFSVGLTSLLLFSAPSFAVKTFDCKKSTQPLLQAICNDDRLSKMDDKMATIYLELKRAIEDIATGEDKVRNINELRQGQNDWMTKVMAPCVNSAQSLQCVSNAYSQRTEELNEQLGQLKQHPNAATHADQQCDAAIANFDKKPPQAREYQLKTPIYSVKDFPSEDCAKRLFEKYGVAELYETEKKLYNKTPKQKAFDKCIDESKEQYKSCKAIANTGPQMTACTDLFGKAQNYCLKKYGN